jgi:anti-sigma factor RsiW
MTREDRGHEPEVAARACPGAETLSCFIDGELTGDRAAAVETHVSQCLECAGVLEQMQSLGNQRRADVSGNECPDGEFLAGYLVGSLAADEQREIDAHVVTCDACVYALAKTHRQLRRARTLDAPVPLATIEQAIVRARPDGGRSLSLVRRRMQAEQHVPVYLRLPVLMPTAFAAGAAFFIAINAANVLPRTRTEQTRAAAVPTGNRRVTTADTLVRSEPRDTAAAVSRVARGVAVEVQAEEREWLLISLPTREHGWVPRRAFE